MSALTESRSEEQDPTAPPAESPAPWLRDAPAAARPASGGSPEGTYLAGPGKAIYRHVGGLLGRRAAGEARLRDSEDMAERAAQADRERKERHRGHGRPWPLRWLIPVGIAAEAVTAYVGIEALVASAVVADGLSLLTALAGAGVACLLADRRLNEVPVPVGARVLEGTFVVILTVLRYESLRIQGGGLLIAAGAAALAAVVSALGLLVIEEIIVGTYPFSIFRASVGASWRRSRSAAARTRLRRIQASVTAAAAQLERHFLIFLLKTEQGSVTEAQQRAAALRAALTRDED
ncbi:MAG: hypothetical protein M3Y33_11275 [Actinomycetota bacterium]|nr:hypothetical protein [Actinomycetota bacterium]